MQTILGSNGTIGSVLAKELKKYTDEIRLVSRNPKKINDSDELMAADLTLPGTVEKAVEGSEIVYLVIGFEYKLQVWQEQWPKLMRATIDACMKHKARLVFFDNVYLYDINSIPHMTEESPVNPPSNKGKVRRNLVRMIMDDVRSGRLMALIARSADFYGPDNDKSFVNQMVFERLKKSSTPMWFINPDKKHSFTFTPDAAKATALLGNTFDAYNQVWHLPTDKKTLTGREIIQLFAKELNKKKNVFVIPLWFLRILGFFSPLLGEMQEMIYQYDRDYVFDSSKFERRFNFRTTTYSEGVKIIVNT